jgi:hypothetical protein
MNGLELDAQRDAVESYARATGLSIIESFTEVETGTMKRERVESHKAIAAARKQGAVRCS